MQHQPDRVPELLLDHYISQLASGCRDGVPPKRNEKADKSVMDLVDLCGQKTVWSAFDILDNWTVILYVHKQSNRRIWELFSSETVFYLFDTVNYCACDVHKQMVASKSGFMCPHVLALKLVKAMKKFEEKETTAVGMTRLMQNLFAVA